MAKADKTLTSLQKLYEKRSALDKQIVTAEKKLVSEAKSAEKAPAAKTTAKKTTAKKKTAAKKPAKK